MATVYTKHAKSIDIDMARIHLLKQVDNYRSQQFMFNQIKPILENFATKKVTQRLITAIKKQFPKYHCYLRWISSMCYLEVEEMNDVPFYSVGTKLSIFLGHIGAYSWAEGDNGKGYYTMKMIEDNNVWIYRIDDSIQSTIKGMELLREKATKWNELLSQMQEIDEEMDKYNGLGTFFKFQS